MNNPTLSTANAQLRWELERERLRRKRCESARGLCLRGLSNNEIRVLLALALASDQYGGEFGFMVFYSKK